MKSRNDSLFLPDICLIVEDHPHSMEFLSSWVKRNYPSSHIFKMTDVSSSLDWIEKNKKQGHRSRILAIIDLGLPDGSGIEIIKEVSAHFSDSQIIVVSIIEDDETIFKALQAGAYGYILKHNDELMVEKILERLNNGEPPISPRVANRILNFFKKPSLGNSNELTQRENETLKLISKGLTVPETAKIMGLATSTVAGYVKIIYQKLHVSNRVQATHEAIRRGLI